MSRPRVLEIDPDLSPFSIQKSLAAVARTHGKSYVAQITEMMRLITGAGQLTPRRYFGFRLYDDAQYSFSDKKDFVGGGASKKLHSKINDARWDCCATDKLVYHNFMAYLGFPVPETRAIYRRSAAFPALTSLSTPAALAGYLRKAEIYPFFSKPAAESRSIGVASVERFDRATDELVFANRRVAVDDFVAAIERFAEGGYLFQERLQPHDDVVRICGDRLPTIRFMVLLDDRGPEIFRTVWKLPVGENVADNFWRKGNILAAIDPASGHVWRAVTGSGPDLRELDVHPDTGAAIKDIDVPLWSEARDLCLAAATALPRIRIQAWDIAITQRGPVLIEVNSKGDPAVPQLATGRGILDTRFRRFVADFARERRTERRRQALRQVEPDQLAMRDMSTAPILEMDHDLPPFSLRRSLATVARTHGKSRIAQLAEMTRLILGEGQLNPRGYFRFRLYDDAEYSFTDKRDFVGGRRSKNFHLMVNDPRWQCSALDKVVFYGLMASLGFPVPETRALYRRSAEFPTPASLSTPAALADHLRTADLYPFFSKPAAERVSIGVASVTRFDHAADELVFANGRRVAVAEFVAAVEPFAAGGYLFQERLPPHEAVARICGDRLATMRVMILLDDKGPEIFRAVWKLPVGDNIADNFWRGNIIAAVDPGSGRTWRAVTGGGPDLREIDTHPNTGASIKDIDVPLWSEVQDVCLAAATALPQIRMQSWDVAATRRGPVLIEVNSPGDPALPQLATGRGILDARLRRFIAENARRRRLQSPWNRLPIAERPERRQR